MTDNCYVVLESFYVKYIIGNEVKLKPVDMDRLFGMVAFENEEAAIDMVKGMEKDGIEVTDEAIINQLPNVDELGSRLRYYHISRLRNTIITYKVMNISILKSNPMTK